jgi:hypothetical protein
MTIWFWVAMGCLMTHELDAMTAREWRIFPGLSGMGDAPARALFVALHVPLFGVILAGLAGDSSGAWVRGLDVFCVAHVVAHAALHGHPDNGFRRWESWAYIGGAGAAGALDVAWLVWTGAW